MFLPWPRSRAWASVLAAFFAPGAGGSAANLTTAAPALQNSGLELVIAIAAALQGAFWAYDGWVKTTFCAGEVRDPQRNVPRATVLGMFIVTGIYLAMTLSYCWVLPVEVMAQSKLVAADVAERVTTGGGKWIAVVVMISTFGANNATVLASARVYFTMARRNLFPALLGSVHPRFHTPAASLVVQGLWSVVLVFSGTFDQLTDTLIFVSWIFYGLGAYGVFVLRRKEPDAPRPYKVPGYPWVPGIFVAFSAVFLVLTMVNDVNAYRTAIAAGKPAVINFALGGALVAAGLPVYWFYRRKASLPPQA